jgi:hypothetical protein
MRPRYTRLPLLSPTVRPRTHPEATRGAHPYPLQRQGSFVSWTEAMNYMIAAVGNMTPADRAVDATWSDRPTNGAGVVFHAVIDMHEHLGRAIAYARINQIVPPWSR